MRALALILLLAAPSQARKTQPVVLSTFFENLQWFPLTKEEMRKAAVDTALQELTRANIVELVGEEEVLAGRLSIEVALVERAETCKVTITFTALKLPSLVTTASVSLKDRDHDGIFQAMSQAGREAGRKMKARLLLAVPPDPADKALELMLGKDWDNMATGQLYSKAQDLKRLKRFDEARELYKSVASRKDRGSQQWKRLSDDELAYGLPLFQAQHELREAAEHRRKADLAKVEKLCREVLEKNPGNEARQAEANRCLDTVEQLKMAMGMVDREEIKSRVRTLQVAMVSHFMETAAAPSLDDLKRMAPQLASKSASIDGYKIDTNSNDYSFEIVLQNGASASVKGNLMRVGDTGFVFRDPPPAK